jgi:hypothetical protein
MSVMRAQYGGSLAFSRLSASSALETTVGLKPESERLSSGNALDQEFVFDQ